jgi:hypothetical protein
MSLDSELLWYVQREYESLERKPELAGIQVYCYYETKDVKEGPVTIGTVVPKSSACLDFASVRGLEKDHMELNKFSPNDKEYNEHMRGDLLRCFEAADRTARGRFSSREYGTDTASLELQNLTRLLLPLTSNMKDRFEFNCAEQEETTYLQPTCVWVNGSESFNRWRTSNQFSCLWIHGKSGSGKSFLAAYITKMLQSTHAQISWDDVSCASTTLSSNCDIEEPDTTALYFLCGVQPALESPSSILGTLIDQLLSRHCRNWKLQAIAVRATKKLRAGGNIPELASLLVELTAIVGGV